MLYGLLLTLFVILCFLLILIILVQKSRSSMGLGGLGGGAQMLFGGSGGQDLFQKMTWIMVALFMGGSLVLAIMKSSGDKSLSYNVRPRAAMPARPSAPTVPTQQPATPAQAPSLPTQIDAMAANVTTAPTEMANAEKTTAQPQ